MADVLTKNQTFATPGEALIHFGVKGMKWGVRKADSTAGMSEGAAIAISALIVGIRIMQVRHDYVDSGKRDAKKNDPASWKKDPALTGKKTHDEITRDVIPSINKGHPTEPGTSMNCRRCTFTYEMRRRGYDVKATRSLSGTGQDAQGLYSATTPKSLDRAVRKEHGRPQSVWGQNAINTKVNGRDMSPEGKSKAIFDALSREPEGSRGELAFGWPFGGGHSVAYEVINGRASVFCTQTQRSWSSPESFHTQMGAMINDAAYTRLDNKELNNDFLKRWVANA